MLLGTTKRTLIQGVPSGLVSTPIRTSTLGAKEGSAMLLLAEVICCCFEHANCWPLCQKTWGAQLSGTWFYDHHESVSRKTQTKVLTSTRSAHTTRPLHASRYAGLYYSAIARIPGGLTVISCYSLRCTPVKASVTSGTLSISLLTGGVRGEAHQQTNREQRIRKNRQRAKAVCIVAGKSAANVTPIAPVSDAPGPAEHQQAPQQTPQQAPQQQQQQLSQPVHAQ